MKCEKERIMRNGVDPNQLQSYEENRDFAISFIKSYMVEAAMDFFSMEERNDCPTSNKPPIFENEDEEAKWVTETMGKLVDYYVFPAWSNCDRSQSVLTEAKHHTEYINVQLDNGKELKIPIGRGRTETHRALKEDQVKNYGHYVLETGVTFIYLTEIMKTPSREKILPLFKILMVQLKATNSKAKYPLELLRMLVQQLSLLSKQKAHQVLHANFVNTKGKPTTNVPADLQMEWLIKEEKKQIKHMFSNKMADNISVRSEALPSLRIVGKKFDEEAETLIRSKKHKRKDSTEDEIVIMHDLRKLRPFQHKEDRSFTNFKKMPKSPLKKLDTCKLQAWFDSKKFSFIP